MGQKLPKHKFYKQIFLLFLTMKTGVIVGIVAVVLIAIVALVALGFTSTSNQNEQGNSEDSTGDSLLVPVPGNEGESVEEMIVNDDGISGNQVENQEFAVEITSSGFSPQNLEINQGDTVTWTNKRSSASWPASDSHPTHNIYPEFDANQGLETGGAYSFTFERIGTWGYHDHLSTSHTSKIIVK